MIKLFKAKSLKKTREIENISLNERTQEKENSGGRSMVEMLGVLAIIGVLSIGGISGYTLAMRRYKANEILDLVNKYAMSVYTSCQSQALINPIRVKAGSVFDTVEGAGIYYNRTAKQNYWHCSRTPFIDSGFGKLPQGVKKIGELNDQANATLVDPLNSNALTITNDEDEDTILVPVLFEDKELCNTVTSIMGSVPTGAEEIICSNKLYTGYPNFIPIKVR